MDALSSQATVAGYAAVLLGASPALPSPPHAHDSGWHHPSRQGVRRRRRCGWSPGNRLGPPARRGGVSAFDVRPAVREEVQSLGATFVEAAAVSTAAEGAGGYARQLGEEQQRNVLRRLQSICRTWTW